jgi:hypothetical protein
MRAVDEGQTVAASLSTPTLFTIAKDLSEMQWKQMLISRYWSSATRTKSFFYS